MAMLFTYVVGWLFNIVLCFTMGDTATILASPIEQPVAQIFYNVLGKGGGITFTVCAFIIIKFVCFTAMQALGRTVFAFSRDRLVPGSRFWTKILPLTGTPILAVWISVFWCIAINLIGLGSYTAIAGVFNVCAIALDWSYCIPIFCKVVFGRFEPGPWHMGKFGKAVNIYACLWTLFVSIIFIMPTARPVNATNVSLAPLKPYFTEVPVANCNADELRHRILGRYLVLLDALLGCSGQEVLHRSTDRGRYQ